MTSLGRSTVRLEAVVFVVALASRLSVILRSGGLHGGFGYDAPVYFAASVALVHGRLPYRDFVFIHPPAQMLLVLPFAWLTKVVSDPTAFMVANLGVTLVGATSAVLVVRICRRLGLGRSARLAAGLFYATWFGVVGAEYLTKLEPFGNVLFLAALLLTLRAKDNDSAWLWTAAGAALGVAVCVKIWWIVPAVAVVLWQVVAGRLRAGAMVVAGGVAAVLAVVVPFAVHAPNQMWGSVITDQLQRNARRDPRPRLRDLSTLSRLNEYLSGDAVTVGTIVAGCLFIAVVVRAWQVRTVRPVVAILAVQAGVIFTAPSWFPYYAAYLAGPAAIAIGAAARPPPAGRGRMSAALGWLPTGLAASVTVAVLATGSATVRPLPGAAELTRAVAGLPCVMSDAPMGQIELNALSRGLDAGCPNWIDVTGRTYGPNKSSQPRREDPRWQRDLTCYLRSGDAIIIVRGRETGLTRETRQAIARDGVLARAGGQTVYRVTSATPGCQGER